MKKINKENRFLIGWIMCIMLLVGVCNLGFVRGTMGSFGNITGQLSPPKIITYISNFPSELSKNDEEVSVKFTGKNYTIEDNTFGATGYEFISWNTMSDGTGEEYIVNNVVPLETDITLYAQWKKIVVIAYGDVNLNGEIDVDDYLLIEKSIADGITLDGQSALNADVNEDGKIDLVDADIIKQVCLGTAGYGGSLPSKPILIYGVYQGGVTDDDVDDGIEGDNDDSNTDEPSKEEGDNADSEGDGTLDEPSSDNTGDDGSSNDNESSENGTSGDLDNNETSNEGATGSGSNGSGSSGSGNGSSGSGSGGKKPSGSAGSGDKPSSGGNANGNNQSDKPSEDDKTDGDIDIDNAEDLENDSVEKEEDDANNIVNQDESNFSYVGIIVFVICLLAVRLIIYVIQKFKQKEDINRKE